LRLLLLLLLLRLLLGVLLRRHRHRRQPCLVMRPQTVQTLNRCAGRQRQQSLLHCWHCLCCCAPPHHLPGRDTQSAQQQQHRG
jgi:hypothetical protein